MINDIYESIGNILYNNNFFKDLIIFNVSCKQAHTVTQQLVNKIPYKEKLRHQISSICSKLVKENIYARFCIHFIVSHHKYVLERNPTRSRHHYKYYYESPQYKLSYSQFYDASNIFIDNLTAIEFHYDFKTVRYNTIKKLCDQLSKNCHFEIYYFHLYNR